MIQIREGIFETNSSSTHAVAAKFPKDGVYHLPDGLPPIDEPIILTGGEYGWENSVNYDWESKANYIATYAWHSGRQQDIDLLIKVIEDFTDRKVKIDINSEDTGIDHQSSDVPEEIFENYETIKAFLFCDRSFYTTGNDNE